MNKTVENKWIQLVFYIIITIVMALIIFPLLDFIYSLINKSTFIYSVHEHIGKPVEFGLILGIVSWVVNNGIKKKNDKKD